MHLLGLIALLVLQSSSPDIEIPTSRAAERTEFREIGARLLAAVDAGALVLSNPQRDLALIRSAAGSVEDHPLGLPLLRALDTLVSRSCPVKHLKITSLYRARAPGRPNEPHANGQAVDIVAFGGYEIRSANPADCEEAALAVISALGEGAYRLGLPMPPHCEPIPFLPPPDRGVDWPFFPPPLAVVHDVFEIVMPRLDADGEIPQKGLSPMVLCWANARYAPLQDIQSARVREAVAAASARGAAIHSLFPDGTNHLHLDTKPLP